LPGCRVTSDHSENPVDENGKMTMFAKTADVEDLSTTLSEQ
jgi:hypothetical protein